jgi:hypothetical protein
MIEHLEDRRLFSADLVQQETAPRTGDDQTQLTVTEQSAQGHVIFERCKPHMTVG